MSHALVLELPDDVYQPLLEAASAADQTPEEWVVTNLRRQLVKPDEKLRRLFGSISLGKPTGTENEQIDADLARAYADSHQKSS